MNYSPQLFRVFLYFSGDPFPSSWRNIFCQDNLSKLCDFLLIRNMRRFFFFLCVEPSEKTFFFLNFFMSKLFSSDQENGSPRKKDVP